MEYVPVMTPTNRTKAKSSSVLPPKKSRTAAEKNVVSEDSIALLEICGLSTVGLAIFSLLLLFWIYKEGLRKEQLRREFGTVPPYRP